MLLLEPRQRSLIEPYWSAVWNIVEIYPLKYGINAPLSIISKISSSVAHFTARTS